ncbi:MAG: EAL domain-containing protein [Candidatus Berkiella sp.]
MHPEISRQELSDAIRNNKITIVYQPLVNIHAANQIIGFEALVRLKTANGIEVTAERILHLSEEFQLLKELTQCIITLGLKGYLQLLPKFPHAYVAINLSASDIDESLIQHLWKTMQDNAIKHSQVMIELTERVAMNQQANQHLKTLRQAGHSLSIDDFGSGASNVRYLQELTPDIVKIDKAFVDWSGDEGPVSTLLTQLITIGKTLHAKVVVEGVETKCQADKIMACGAHFGQGYFWYPPLSVAEILQLNS